MLPNFPVALASILASFQEPRGHPFYLQAAWYSNIPKKKGGVGVVPAMNKVEDTQCTSYG